MKRWFIGSVAVLGPVACILAADPVKAEVATPWSIVERAKSRPAEGTKAAVDAQVKIALQFVKKADAKLSRDLTKDSMKSAMFLYSEAGQILERAVTDYTKLGPQGGVTRIDVESANKTMKYCMNRIQEIQKRYKTAP